MRERSPMASTPVSRTASVAEPAGGGHAVGLVPTDRGEGPLVDVGGVVRRGLGLADAIAVDGSTRGSARYAAIELSRCRACDIDDVHPQGRDRGCLDAAAEGEDRRFLDRGQAGDETDDRASR